MRTDSDAGEKRPECTVWWVNQFAVTPDESGGTRHYDMARELRALGIDARIVASDLGLHSRKYSVRRGPRDIRPLAREINSVPFHWLPAGSYETNDWRRLASMLIFTVAAFAFLVTRRLRRGDVIIGSSPHLFAAVGAWAAARVRRRTFIFEVRDLWPESFTAVSGQHSSMAVRVMRFVSDLLYRRSDAIMILAEGNRGIVHERGATPERISFIPNGVDTSAFKEKQNSDIAEKPVRFVYAGAHGPANGLDVAVRAINEVARRGRDDIELVLVGDGPIKEELVDLAASLGSPVTFADPVPKKDVPALLAANDIGLMVLADTELFQYGVSPNKLFDYLAAGLPVLSNVPGFVSRVVDESGAGMSVAPGDVRALADGMIAMADRRLHGEPWSNGRDYIETHFERRALARQLRDLINAVSG